MAESREVIRVLFVCTGNTCRSPLAEAILRAELASRGGLGVEVCSAGVDAWEGGAASEGAVRAAARMGIDLSDHRTRPLTHDEVAAADLIYGMTTRHVAAAEHLGGEGKAFLVTAVGSGVLPDGERDGPGIEPGFGVPDPFGGGDEEYEATAEVLCALMRVIADDLVGVVEDQADQPGSELLSREGGEP